MIVSDITGITVTCEMRYSHKTFSSGGSGSGIVPLNSPGGSTLQWARFSTPGTGCLKTVYS